MAAAADHLGYVVNTSDTVAGVDMTSVEVGIYDQYNNLRTGDNGVNIALALTTNPHGDTSFSVTSPKSTSSGIAIFDDINMTKAGAGYKVTATSTGLMSCLLRLLYPKYLQHNQDDPLPLP